MKKMRTLRRVAQAAPAGLLCAMLAGCGHSPPTRYYTLDAVAPATRASVQPGEQPLAPVQLSAVHIPDEVDRPEVVRRTQRNRLAIGEEDRWAAPLATMMRRVLAEDLLARLPAGTFVLPAAPAPAGTRRLVVTVLGLDAQANGVLSVHVGWSLVVPRSGTVTAHTTTLVEHDAGREAKDQAAALSRALGTLADEIAASLVSAGPMAKR